MPTYEYACQDCGEHLEVVQSFKDAPLSTCGACGGRLRKVFSAAGIIFKGSGYYVTDSRKKEGAGAKADTGKPDGAKPDGGKSDSAKSDAPKSDGGKSDGAKSGTSKPDAAPKAASA